MTINYIHHIQKRLIIDKYNYESLPTV